MVCFSTTSIFSARVHAKKHQLVCPTTLENSNILSMLSIDLFLYPTCTIHLPTKNMVVNIDKYGSIFQHHGVDGHCNVLWLESSSSFLEQVFDVTPMVQYWSIRALPRSWGKPIASPSIRPWAHAKLVLRCLKWPQMWYGCPKHGTWIIIPPKSLRNDASIDGKERCFVIPRVGNQH